MGIISFIFSIIKQKKLAEGYFDRISLAPVSYKTSPQPLSYKGANSNADNQREIMYS